MSTFPLLPGMNAEQIEVATSPDVAVVEGAPRLRRANRHQILLEPCELDRLIPDDHEVRALWAVVERMDLSAFYDEIQARGRVPGRSATDPKILVAVWLYATKNGVGSGREVERLCRDHAAYRWLRGGVELNYHTLNDFRVADADKLDHMFTDVLACLVHQGAVTIHRIAQDGTRVRASAGSSSFRRRATLEALREEMRQHVEAVRKRLDDPACDASPPQRAAQVRAARERQERVEAALQERAQLEEAKAQQKAKPSKNSPPRASTTDPQARVMKLPGGGYGPGYNIQYAGDVASRAIVGVDVTNAGSDVHESAPMRRQVEVRTGKKVHEHLLDGGFVGLDSIERAAREQVAVYAPVPAAKKPGQAPHAPRRGDGPGVSAWRCRMATEEGQLIYRQRASVSETINADLKAWRGLRQVRVRGLAKVRCIALWCALTYNVLHFAGVLIG
jgi:transposase